MNGVANKPGVARGFTLMEMLVTLTLLAMISTLLWQAMQQVLRVEQVLQRSGVDGQLTVVRREWLRSVIEASLVERIGAPRQLKGDEHQFTVVSAEAIGMPGLRSASLQIRFETDSRSGMQRLVVADAQPGEEVGARAAGPVELLSWQGRPGAVRFLNGAGQWVNEWPSQASLTLSIAGNTEADALRSADAALPRLPRAVFLDLGSDVGGSLIVAISVTDPGRTRLFDWERQ